MKKIIIISIIVGILALGTGIYFAWRSSLSGGEQEMDIFSLLTQTPETPSTSSGQVAAPKLKVLSKNEVFDYWIFESVTASSTATSTALKKQEKKIFYISSEGKIYKISDSGEELIADSNIKNLQAIISSNDGNFILIKSSLANRSNFDIYDVSKNLWLPAISNAVSSDFSPDSKRIAYFENIGVKGFDLIIKDLFDVKKKPQKIMTLNLTDFIIDWIDTSKIILSSKPAFEVQSDIFQIDLKTNSISKLFSANGLWVNWSKLSVGGLRFFASGGRNYSFDFIDSSGQKRGTFSFKTMPDKCAISSLAQIYCAIPKNQDVFSTLIFPDDYLKRGVFFNDVIYLINLNENKFNLLYSSDDLEIDAVNLKTIDNQLVFINKYDKKLYGLEIK